MVLGVTLISGVFWQIFLQRSGKDLPPGLDHHQILLELLDPLIGHPQFCQVFTRRIAQRVGFIFFAVYIDLGQGDHPHLFWCYL